MQNRVVYSELRLLMSEIRKWLVGDYGPPPGGVTFLSRLSDFEYAVLRGLSDVELVIRAKALLGDTRQVIDQVALAHPSETRLINNLTFHSSTLSDMLRRLEEAT